MITLSSLACATHRVSFFSRFDWSTQTFWAHLLDILDTNERDPSISWDEKGQSFTSLKVQSSYMISSKSCY